MIKRALRILLIRPPASYPPGSTKPSISLPLGLLSIGAVVERAGFAVEIYDAQLDLEVHERAAGSQMLMGHGWEQVEQEIARRECDIIGVSCSFSSQFSNAQHTVRIARRVRPRAFIVAGGAHATSRPADFFPADLPVDLVCIGEGEQTMLEIALAASGGRDPRAVAGTVAAKDGELRFNPPRPYLEDLDELPFPAYHLVPVEDYLALQSSGKTDRPGLPGAQRSVSVITSRGCPFNCVFCSVHLHMGKRWRGHSVGYVLEHVRLLTEQYHMGHLHFEDDNISANRARFAGIVQGLAALRRPVTWDTPNGIRVDTLSEELVANCKQSGCVYLVFGVESGVQRVLDNVVDKRLNLEAVLRAAVWCSKAELDVMSFFVIGFPGESPGDMLATVDFALRLKRDYDVTPHMFVATPLPGTRLEKLCLEKGFLAAPLSPGELALMTQGNFQMDGGTFCRGDVEAALGSFYSGYRKAFVLNALRFLLKRPLALLALPGLLLGMRRTGTLKENIMKVMQVKYASLGARPR